MTVSMGSSGTSGLVETSGTSKPGTVRPRRNRAVSGLGLRRRLGRGAEISVLLTPALLLYMVFVLLPVGLAAWYSLYKWNGIGPLDNFVGLNNYRRALGDSIFRGAVLHNAIIVVLSLVVQFPLTLGLALMLNRKMRGRSVLRLVLFAPYVLSEVITAIAWLLILQPDGLVDQTMSAVGLGGLVQLWLANMHVVLFSLFVVITWKYLGFGIILFLAGLQNVPLEVKEAAIIDGTSVRQMVRYITVPLLGPTIRIWAFLSIIGSLQLFDIIWIMTEGGPSNASNTMATYLIDHGFQRYEFGYGSAAATLLFLISFIVSLAYQRFVLRRDIDGALTRRVG
jgi:raffinose/stachyose/melibiose transport system permease protein